MTDELKLKLEEAGLEADIVDDLVSRFGSKEKDEEEIDKDIIEQLKIKELEEPDWRKKAQIRAQIISYKIDKGEY